MASENPYQSPGVTGEGELSKTPTSTDGIQRITWQTVIAVFSVAILSGVLTWVMGEQDDDLPISQQLMGLVVLVFFVRWTTYDSRRFGMSVTVPWILAMVCCAIGAVPVYFFRTRGWSGWLPTLVVFGILLGLGFTTELTVELIRILMPAASI